jgi:integrase
MCSLHSSTAESTAPRSCRAKDGPPSYRRAQTSATKLAMAAGELPEGTHWHPHQLRHAAATRIRAKFGLDAVRAVLGHTTVIQSAEYADLGTDLAVATAAALG